MDNSQLSYADQIAQERRKVIEDAIGRYRSSRDEWMRKARSAEYKTTRATFAARARQQNHFVIQGRAALCETQ